LRQRASFCRPRRTFATAASAQTTFRDGSGRITGTATRDANGTTTFRDAAGRITGTRERERRMGR
jgi:YD repeat-containing protein